MTAIAGITGLSVRDGLLQGRSATGLPNEARLAPDEASTEGLSQQQLERLRSLGYIR